jgi:plastocyanin
MRLLLMVAGFSVGIAITAGVALTGTNATHAAAKQPAHATVMIRHQLHGCHAWSVNGGAFKAKQAVRLARGGTITFVDNDVMPHTLIQTGGPAVHYTGRAAMRHMGATVRATFARSGAYRFTTKAGEDYMAGVKTIGEDNVLRLVVKVG